jgi:hypothetical protein
MKDGMDMDGANKKCFQGRLGISAGVLKFLIPRAIFTPFRFVDCRATKLRDNLLKILIT